MLTQRRFGFASSYVGGTYREVYLIDPRFLVPGAIVLAVGILLITKMWMIVYVWGLPLCGIVLVLSGLLKRHYFEAAPGVYRVGWAFGPIAKLHEIPAAESTLFVRRGDGGGGGDYGVMLKYKGRSFELLIFGATKQEINDWVNFLQSVVAGRGSVLPPKCVV